MRRVIVLVAAAAAFAPPLRGYQANQRDAVINATTFRNIGPFRTAAWITEIAVPDAPLHDHLYTIYAASGPVGSGKRPTAG